MECRLETKMKAVIESLVREHQQELAEAGTQMKAVIESLVREHQQELAEAGTLADLEELTCQIGDMVTRELTQQEVARRAKAMDTEQAKCPDCGTLCPRGEPEPVILDGLRGQLACSQPSYYCRRCRRSFFPSGGLVGTSSPEHGHPADVAEGGLGG